MKAVVFGAGLAVGYVLGARAGRGSYEQIRARARQFWQNPKVQDKVSGARAAVKDKAPQAPAHLKDAVKKAGGGVSGALHRGHGADRAAEAQQSRLEHGTYSGQPTATVENPAAGPEPGEAGTAGPGAGL